VRWPWAKREHWHIGGESLDHGRCAGCGHLILLRHVDTKKVERIDRSSGTGISQTLAYSLSCAPNYDREEIALDGTAHYYARNKKGEGWHEVEP